MTRSLTTPMKSMTEAAGKIALGEVDENIDLPVRG